MRDGARVASLFLLAGLLLTPRARADAQTSARLEVVDAGPDSGCIDRDRLALAVEQRLGREVFTDDATLLVRLSFARQEPHGFVAKLELRNATNKLLGARELVTRAGCDDLDSSLALVTALLVDSPAAVEESERQQAEAKKAAEPRSPPPPPPPATAPPAAPAPPPAEALEVMANGAYVALLGHAPGVMSGARFGAQVKPPAFIWFGIDLSVYFPVEVRDEATGGAAEVRRSSVGFSACPWVGRRSPSLSLCLGQEIGLTQTRASGFDVNREPKRLDFLTYARTGMDFLLTSPVWLRVGLTGGVPLVRDRYIFVGPDLETHELFRTQPVVVIGELGLGVRLP